MRLLTKLMLLPVMLLLSGCMHNNGDIGDFFGTWRVETITVDDAEDESYPGNVFFQFQTSVVRVVETLPHGDMMECFGSWSDEGDILILDFSYNVDPTSDVYDMPSVTRLARKVNTLNLSEVTSRKMSWEFTDSIGQKVVYKLRKQ